MFVSSFAAKLRSAGIPTPLSAIERSAASLDLIGPTIRMTDLYWALRVSFVTRQEDLELFDRVFDAVFSSEFSPRGESRRQRQGTPGAGNTEHKLRLSPLGSAITGAGLNWSSQPSIVDDDDDDDESDAEEETLLPELAPSDDATDVDRPFDLLDEQELVEAGRSIERAMADWPMRRSRRVRIGRKGRRPDLRSSLRQSMRSGGEPLTLMARSPRQRPRRVVVIVDVSGSMESFARSYLHLTRALAIAGHAEVFAFGTSLTRITTALRHRSPIEAVDMASELVVDRFGGTRIAANIRHLLRHPHWSGLLRGAVVVVASDGWDTDLPEALDAQMEKLSRIANRVVWVNPRSAATGFEPLVGAMVAAMPHCDAVVSGHSVGAMDELVAAIVA